METDIAIGAPVTVTSGIYRGIRGTVATVETDEYGTDVGVRVEFDPDKLLNKDIGFVHVEPSDVTKR